MFNVSLKINVFHIETQYNAFILKLLKNKTNTFLYHLNPYEHIIPDHPPTQIRWKLLDDPLLMSDCYITGITKYKIKCGFWGLFNIHIFID